MKRCSRRPDMGTQVSRRRTLYGQVQRIGKKKNLPLTLPSKFCAWKRYISSVERVFAGEDAGVPMACRRAHDMPVFLWLRRRRAPDMGTQASCRRALYCQVQSIGKKKNLLSTLPSKFCAWKRYISSVERVFAGEDAGVPMACRRFRVMPAFPCHASVPMACRCFHGRPALPWQAGVSVVSPYLALLLCLTSGPQCRVRPTVRLLPEDHY